MAFRWRADDGPKLNTGLVALWYFRRSGPVLLRNPIFLCFFRGGPDPLSPPLDPHMCHLGVGLLVELLPKTVSLSCHYTHQEKCVVKNNLHTVKTYKSQTKWACTSLWHEILWYLLQCWAMETQASLRKCAGLPEHHCSQTHSMDENEDSDHI